MRDDPRVAEPNLEAGAVQGDGEVDGCEFGRHWSMIISVIV